LIFDLPEETGLARARSRNAAAPVDEGRFETEDLRFFRRVREGYLTLAAAEPKRYAVIEAAGTPEEVFEKNTRRSARARAAGAGVNDAAALLAETAKRGELHHAIILHGPAPDALRRAAIQIAKALNCVNKTQGDDCLACQRIERNIHPDVHIVEVGSERKMISVEQIRDLLSSASLRPYEGRNKVYIIDPADALSPADRIRF